MKKVFIILIILVFSLTACQSTIDEPLENEEINGSLEDEIIDEESNQEPDQPVVHYYDELVISINNGDLIEVNKLMKEFSIFLSEIEADDIIYKYIQLLKDNLDEVTNEYYNQDNIEIHSMLMKTIEQSNIEFVTPYGLVGSSKKLILKLINEDKYRELLNATFDKGYGLLSAEGAYYPIIDYVLINEVFSQNVSDSMKTYLGLASEDLIEPMLVEEYLTISPIELAERAVKYEAFLKEYPTFTLKENIRNRLMLALYKFASPSPFDRMLDETFMFSDELTKAYDYLLSRPECPVINEVVKGILEFSDERDGILGSYGNMNELYNNAYKLHKNAGEMIDILYMNE